MAKHKVHKPKLRENDITFLKKERRRIQDARHVLARLPMTDAVRTKLAQAGIPRELSRYLRDTAGVDVLLDLRWQTIRDVFDELFNKEDVDSNFVEVEKYQ